MEDRCGNFVPRCPLLDTQFSQRFFADTHYCQLGVLRCLDTATIGQQLIQNVAEICSKAGHCGMMKMVEIARTQRDRPLGEEAACHSILNSFSHRVSLSVRLKWFGTACCSEFQRFVAF